MIKLDYSWKGRSQIITVWTLNNNLYFWWKMKILILYLLIKWYNIWTFKCEKRWFDMWSLPLFSDAHCLHWFIYIYDRLKSTSGLKSTSTPQIGVHWRHYLKSRSNFLNILKSASFPNSHVYNRSVCTIILRQK